MKLRIIKSATIIAFSLSLLAGCTTQDKLSPEPVGVYSIEVLRDSNELHLLKAGKVVRVYPISVRETWVTPKSTFVIKVKMENPPWVQPGTGKRVLPNSPENILGTRYFMMTSSEEPEKIGFGIHGTNDPENIGNKSSQGCISMTNQDIEELSGLIPRLTEVRIFDK